MLSGVCCANADVWSSLDAILSGYAQDPSLRLTCEQACRVWTLSDARCQGMFDALVDAGFLRRGADGAYSLAR